MRIFVGGPAADRWRRTTGRCAASLIVMTCLSACGGSEGGGSTAPGATPTPAAAPGPVVAQYFSRLDIAGRALTVGWEPVAGADRYIVEAGSSSGATDLGTLSVSAPAVTATLSDVAPRDAIYARVRAANAAGMSPQLLANELRIEMPDMRNVIEGLFLGTGPFSEGTRPRGEAVAMGGWASGSRVNVRVPQGVGGGQYDAVAQGVDDFKSTTGLDFVIERATLTLAEHARERPYGVTFILGEGLCSRTPGAPGDVPCAISDPTPQFATASVRLNGGDAPRVWTHEFGHAIGLHHMFVRAKVKNQVDLRLYQEYDIRMGGAHIRTTDDNGSWGVGSARADGRFSTIELEAIRRVYAAGLRAGSTPSDFVARGLITP